MRRAWTAASRVTMVTEVDSSILEEMYYIRIKPKRIENYKRVTPVKAILRIAWFSILSETGGSFYG